MIYIKQQQQEDGQGVIFGITSFADWSDEELKSAAPGDYLVCLVFFGLNAS